MIEKTGVRKSFNCKSHKTHLTTFSCSHAIKKQVNYNSGAFGEARETRRTICRVGSDITWELFTWDALGDFELLKYKSTININFIRILNLFLDKSGSCQWGVEEISQTDSRASPSNVNRPQTLDDIMETQQWRLNYQESHHLLIVFYTWLSGSTAINWWIWSKYALSACRKRAMY